MKNLHEEFLRKQITKVNELKEEYKTLVHKAKNKEMVHRKFYYQLMEEYKTLQFKLNPYDRFFIEINEAMEEDASKNFATLFQEKIQTIPVSKKKAVLADLIQLHSIDTFFEFWKMEDEKYCIEGDDQTNKIKSSIHWKGKSETEFVQLIYALYEANLIEGEGIIKVVKEFAQVLNYKLSSNWQSNHSKSLNERNNDYEPKIFNRLSNAYEEYRSKRINREK